MTLHSDNIRRAQPWLGTVVEISIRHEAVDVAQQACSAAFAAVAGIDRLMSYHRSDSELTRLNTAAPGTSVKVSPDTWNVLMWAQHLHRASDGLFDCAIARRLEKENFLPPVGNDTDSNATQEDVLLPEPGIVIKRRRLRLDLGGIAKGYAVDCGMEVLQKYGLTSACINAGGDISSMGDARPVYIRDPQRASRMKAGLKLKDEALATSAGYFGARQSAQGTITALVNPKSDRCIDLPHSISVLAAKCVIADALTKVVSLSGDIQHAALHSFHAKAWIIE